tara:strand:+ start:1203 stop:1439 length:237 start_codon:yes stop_codon:yes gene_type:complete
MDILKLEELIATQRKILEVVGKELQRLEERNECLLEFVESVQGTMEKVRDCKKLTSHDTEVLLNKIEYAGQLLNTENN